MYSISNIFIASLIYIINIKLCFNYVTDDTKCLGNYSTFSMNCSKNEYLKAELLSRCSIFREDGLKCMNDNSFTSQKDFYGVYFNEFKEINSSGYNIIENDIKRYEQLLNENVCENERLILCQQLINICVLNLRNDKENEYCKYILKYNAKFGNILSQEAHSYDEIQVSYTLDKKNNNDNKRLIFWVSKFASNGTIIKFEKLENDFLQCNNSNDAKTQYKYFGNNIESECSLDINKYLNNDTNFFYEIFLENNHESDENKNIVV